MVKKEGWETVFISLDKKFLKKSIMTYACVSLFLLIFIIIYEQFSHGVTSIHMRISFTIPLLFGSLLCTLFYFIPIPSRITFDIWNMSMTTWICGLILDGVFYIYGTDKAFVDVFYYVGGLLSLFSIILYLLGYLKSKKV